MTTGYTAAIHEGKDVSFQEFALGCARAFGALITMRDEPTNAAIPTEFEPRSYYRESFERAVAHLLKVNNTRLDEWQEQQEKEVAKSSERIKDTIQEKGELRVRYEQMLAEVEAWRVPTEEHQGLKDFMIEQLKSSIVFDCSTSHLQVQKLLPVQQYANLRVEAATKSVQRSRKDWEDEQQRAASRSDWVRALRESLK